jgi:hypothetical protein
VVDFLDSFAQPIAYNPDTEKLVADAEFTVHLPDDLSFANPLTVRDPVSDVPISPLRANAVGVLPDFRVPGDPPQVLLKSGSFVTKVTSVFGAVIAAGLAPAVVAEAIAARAAAQSSADAAGVSATNAAGSATVASEAAARAEAVPATTDAIMASIIADPESEASARIAETIAGGFDPASVGWDIILVAGQSNAAGRGLGINAEYLDAPDARVYQFANLSSPFADQVVLAKDPLFHQELPGSTVGFPMTFAKLYAATVPSNRRVLIVPTAHGDTGFGSTGEYTWRVGQSGPINLWSLALAQMAKALALPGQNRVAAILWHQGEANSGTTPSTYRTDMLALIDSARANFGDDVPFVLGQMSPSRIASSPGYAAIDAVHQEIPSLRDHCAFWKAVPLYNSSGDVVHFSADGQRINGQTAFHAYELALGAGGIAERVAVPVPPAVSGVDAVVSDTSAAISWSRTPRAYAYRTRYRVVGAGSWTAGPTTGQDAATSVALTGLALGQNYEVQVAGDNDAGTGAWSASKTFTTAVPVPGFHDTFAGARTLYPGFTEDGKAYERYGTGSNSGTWTVASGVVKYNGENSHSMAVADGLAANGSVALTIGDIGSAVGGLVGRLTDANNYLRVNLRQSAGVNRLQLMKYVGGTGTLLGTSGSTKLSAAGSVVELVMSGDQVSVKLNGETVIAGVTETHNQSATRHGFFNQNSDLVISYTDAQFTAA